MFKLMKYEFRKLRTALLAMLGTLVALEIGFLVGNGMHKNELMATSLALIALLAFIVYAYVVLAGLASYSRELQDKSGYLVFMVPVHTIGVVLSKLVFTMVTALVVTALFAATAWFDLRMVIQQADLDQETLNQLNMMLRLGLGANATIQQIMQAIGFGVLTVLIEIMVTMCTGYLAITLSATLLQNKKGFLRALISLVLFLALTWGSSWLTNKLLYSNFRATEATLSQLSGVLGWSMLLNTALSALFAGVSAWLLDRKVNL